MPAMIGNTRDSGAYNGKAGPNDMANATQAKGDRHSRPPILPCHAANHRRENEPRGNDAGKERIPVEESMAPEAEMQPAAGGQIVGEMCGILGDLGHRPREAVFAAHAQIRQQERRQRQNRDAGRQQQQPRHAAKSRPSPVRRPRHHGRHERKRREDEQVSARQRLQDEPASQVRRVPDVAAWSAADRAPRVRAGRIPGAGPGFRQTASASGR